jgi:hypothetical protein
MAISINPSVPVIGAQAVGSVTDGVVLQPGTVVSAQVQNVLAENLVRIVIANLSLDVLTEVALTPGQNLQLSVSQAQDGMVRLQIVGQGTGAAAGDAVTLAPNLAPNTPVGPAANVAAASDPLTPLERIAVSVAAESAAATQQSLAPLFANLNAAASANGLPPALQQVIANVLAQQTSLDPDLGGGDIQNAFQKSGLFLEASLASGTAPSGSTPDLKAALIVLRQTLASTAGGVESTAAGVPASAAKPTINSPSLVPSQMAEAIGQEIGPQARSPLSNLAAGDPGKLLIAQTLLGAEPRSVTTAAALNLLQEAVQQTPRTSGNPAAIITSPDGRNVQGTALTNTPPPPFRGALPSAQPIADPTIAPNAPLPTTVHHLLEDTDAALARQTLLQVASLPDRSDPTGNRIDPSVPRWNFEIPFATPQGTAMAQFEISRDGGGNEIEAAKRTWQARFSLNVEPAGPVHVLVSLSGDRTSVRMWAERPQTAAQLRAGAGELSQALRQAELSPGDIVIREGAPPQPAPAKAGHFLDRAL